MSTMEKFDEHDRNIMFKSTSLGLQQQRMGIKDDLSLNILADDWQAGNPGPFERFLVIEKCVDELNGGYQRPN